MAVATRFVDVEVLAVVSLLLSHPYVVLHPSAVNADYLVSNQFTPYQFR